MENSLKDLMARLTNQTVDNIRPACKKCGYPGHFTYQCRNFVKVNPNKDIVLDISSTSSDSVEDFVSPLTKLRELEKEVENNESVSKSLKKRKKKLSERKPLCQKDPESSSSIDEVKSIVKQRKKHKHRHKKSKYEDNSDSNSSVTSHKKHEKMYEDDSDSNSSVSNHKKHKKRYEDDSDSNSSVSHRKHKKKYEDDTDSKASVSHEKHKKKKHKHHSYKKKHKK